MKIKYPLAKETINDEDIDALCTWLKSYPRLTKGQLTLDVEKNGLNILEPDMPYLITLDLLLIC